MNILLPLILTLASVPSFAMEQVSIFGMNTQCVIKMQRIDAPSIKRVYENVDSSDECYNFAYDLSAAYGGQHGGYIVKWRYGGLFGKFGFTHYLGTHR